MITLLPIEKEFLLRLKKIADRQLVPVFLLGALAIGYVFFNIHLDDIRAAKSEQHRIFFQDENIYHEEGEGFWVKEKSGFFPFRLDRRIQDNCYPGVFIQIEVIEEGDMRLKDFLSLTGE